MKVWDAFGSLITQTMSQRTKGRDTGKSMYPNKKLLDMLENSKKTTFLSSVHRFKKDCCCWSISTCRLPKTQLAAVATIAAEGPAARALTFDHKKLPTPAGLGVIPCEKNGGVTTSGMIGQRETKTNGANLCRSCQICFKKEASVTKDGSLPGTDGSCKHYLVHNGTFPAFAHSNTHAITCSLFSFRDSSNQSSRIDNDLAPSLRALKRSHSWSKRFASIACLTGHIHAQHEHHEHRRHSRQRRRAGDSHKLQKPVNAPAQEESLAILPNKPLIHQVHQLFSSFARVSQRSLFPAYIHWTANVPADAANTLSTYHTKWRHRFWLPRLSWDRALPFVPYSIFGALDWTPFPCTASLGKNPIIFHVPNSLSTSRAPVILVARTSWSLCLAGSLSCLQWSTCPLVSDWVRHNAAKFPPGNDRLLHTAVRHVSLSLYIYIYIYIYNVFIYLPDSWLRLLIVAKHHRQDRLLVSPTS